MTDQSKPDDKLADTGKPDDPAKKENPDTREEQQKPFKKPDDREAKKEDDPALETTRKAGQGGG